jgi:hypothetical protein
MTTWSELGDPGALREQARRLRAQADRMREVAAWADRHVDGMLFQGPAAERFRQESEHGRLRAVRCAEQIDNLANLLDQGAKLSEAQRAEYARQLRLAEERRREEQRRRQSGGGAGW